jgi:8-oxo-dGTP pyrophosphatase MutT (NUDIX family)
MSDYRRTGPFKPVDAAYRLAFRTAFPLAVAWWRLRRPRHDGAVVAVYVGAALLLVRASYRTAWDFPGGGIRRGETPDAAARRELVEEIGLVATHMQPWGLVRGIWDGQDDHVHVFELRLNEPPQLRLDNREIIAARLELPDELDTIPLTGPVSAYLSGKPFSQQP